MTKRLQIFLLGPPRVELAGEPVDIPRRKGLALLAYLALSSEDQRRDTLAALLSPEWPSTQARIDLRRDLSTLNKALGGDWLLADRETIGLRHEAGLWVDVNRFQQQLGACQSHGHPLDVVCEACCEPLSEAVQLYRADFLSGFSLPDSPEFDIWQTWQTEYLRRELTKALERLLAYHSERSEFEPAIAYAQRWLTVDPGQEVAHRALMQLYAWTGDRVAALRQYQHCLQLLEAELGLPPAGETTALYERIRSGDLGRGQAETSPRPFHPSPPRHNLPAPTTPFVGRESESAAIARLLDDPALRLVTILGPGGIGKSRLALQVGGSYLQRFAHGVCYVRLTPLETPAALVATIAEALDFSFYEGGQPRRQLLDYLREKSLLLLLDNFEHLLEGVGLVQEILQAAPAVKVLVTSRERLKLRGETVFSLGGLDFPDPPPEPALQSPATDRERDRQAVEAYSAVQLFLQTARQVRPDFDPEGDDWPAICNLCQVVQGMPLGLILAAAWVEMLSPQEIVAELKQSLDFLATDLHDVPVRQRSMRAVFDHSWRLLSEPERTVCQQLSLFRGGFSREAAAAVSGASLRLLLSLVDKSLLQRTSTGRFEIHELLRQYGAGKLAEDVVQETSARDRHSAYYCAVLQRREADLKGPRQQAALDEIEVDIENVRLAWHWAVEHGQLVHLERALESLAYFHAWRGRYEEGEAACRAASARLQADQNGPSSRVLVRVLTWQGYFNRRLGRSDLAGQQVGRGLSLLDGPVLAGQETQPERAALLLELGQQTANLAKARTYFAESLALYHALDDRWGTVQALQLLGTQLMTWTTNQYDQGRRYLAECLQLRREMGDRQGSAETLWELGFAAMLRGELEHGEPLLRQALALCQELGDRPATLRALGALGTGLSHRGRLEEAYRLRAEALAIARDMGHRPDIASAEVMLAVANLDLGNYETARQQLELALSRDRETDDLDPSMRAFALWNLGEVALAEKMYAEADERLQESIRIYQEIGNSVTQHDVMISLGLAAWGLGRLDQAKACLKAVLQVALEHQRQFTYNSALVLAALIAVGENKPEQAVALFARASRYPWIANVRYFQELAGTQVAAAAAGLPQTVVEAARKRGQALDMETTAVELLAELSHE